MKVKLLKKVRKEFSINHYPDGFKRQVPGFRSNAIVPTEKYGPNTYTLERNNVVLAGLDLSKHWVDKPPQVIYDDLYRIMMVHIREIYGKYGTRRINKVKKQQQPKKLWYKSI